MKNITVSLLDEIYRRGGIRAAERDTSVSALVRGFLTELGEEESGRERRKWLQKEGLATIRSFRAGDRFTRRQVHDRHALRSIPLRDRGRRSRHIID